MGYYIRAINAYNKSLESLLEKNEEYLSVTEIIDRMSAAYADMEKEFIDDETKEKHAIQAQNKRDQSDFNSVIKKGKTKRKSIIKKKHLSKMYRRIVERTHPDKLEQLDLSEAEKIDREYIFKDVVPAYKKLDIPAFFECANEIRVSPQLVGHYDFFSKALKVEVQILEEKIAILKNTIAWTFYECEGDPECERKVVERTVKSIYK